MTGTRTAHQCHKNGCDTEACWRVAVEFVVRLVGQAQMNMSGLSTVCVCDRHRNAGAGYVCSAQNKRAIAAGIMRQGLPMPDIGNIEAKFLPLKHDDLPKDTAPQEVGLQ